MFLIKRSWPCFSSDLVLVIRNSAATTLRHRYCENLVIGLFKIFSMLITELVCILENWKQIKENKAPCPDGILIDNQTFIQLGESGMILILKKSDLSMPSNHWQIKLLFIVTKIINWMILHWIHLKNDPHLRPTQYGFRQTRPERSTTTRGGL